MAQPFVAKGVANYSVNRKSLSLAVSFSVGLLTRAHFKNATR